jgi:excisionase family DNA binding protein
MAAEREPLMSVAEVAERLSVSPRSALRLIERHELRGVRIGRLWRVRAEDVERLATPAPESYTAGAFGLSNTTNLTPAPAGETRFRELVRNNEKSAARR